MLERFVVELSRFAAGELAGELSRIAVLRGDDFNAASGSMGWSGADGRPISSNSASSSFFIVPLEGTRGSMASRETRSTAS